jgi:glycosyltransferase involved in cell wall biosynthesis
MRKDVDRVYQGLDIFVLPSHREGFPRAAMEAAASGLPVIATDIRGCRQVVEDGVNGFLFPVRDVDALTAAINGVGSDEGLRSQMSRASVDRARAHFDERQIVKRVMGAYAEVAVRKGLYPELVGRWGSG